MWLILYLHCIHKSRNVSSFSIILLIWVNCTHAERSAIIWITLKSNFLKFTQKNLPHNSLPRKWTALPRIGISAWRQNLFHSRPRYSRELVTPNGVGCSACHGDWSLFAHEICRHAPSVTARKHWNLRATTSGYRATGFSVLPREGGSFATATRINFSVSENNCDVGKMASVRDSVRINEDRYANKRNISLAWILISVNPLNCDQMHSSRLSYIIQIIRWHSELLCTEFFNVGATSRSSYYHMLQLLQFIEYPNAYMCNMIA